MATKDKKVEAEPVEARGTATEEKARSCAYCGPTVRGVARQFTVFSGEGMPDALREFQEQYPGIARLIVPVNDFAEMRKRVTTPGTAEYILCENIKTNLK